ncbi:hypothetical protein [Streptomyces sp. NPDC057403]|uniref:hypothetical protein n=1 Tax=Streptomyces sp. NPDC057403 TaxID=3346119 RepID=UPI003680B8F6
MGSVAVHGPVHALLPDRRVPVPGQRRAPADEPGERRGLPGQEPPGQPYDHDGDRVRAEGDGRLKAGRALLDREVRLPAPPPGRLLTR